MTSSLVKRKQERFLDVCDRKFPQRSELCILSMSHPMKKMQEMSLKEMKKRTSLFRRRRWKERLQIPHTKGKTGRKAHALSFTKTNYKNMFRPLLMQVYGTQHVHVLYDSFKLFVSDGMINGTQNCLAALNFRTNGLNVTLLKWRLCWVCCFGESKNITCF